jgi:hypothetical protein
MIDALAALKSNSIQCFFDFIGGLAKDNLLNN